MAALLLQKAGYYLLRATKDGMFRAFNKQTGKLLWETKLPAAGFATPATYEVNGKQYVVIACGGGKLGTNPGIVMFICACLLLNKQGDILIYSDNKKIAIAAIISPAVKAPELHYIIIVIKQL